MPIFSSNSLNSPQRRDDIQGLRAIAVLSVLLFHTFPDIFPGGFIGVDVFFVISGFLITGIVHRDAVAGRFSIADFYRRRVRRILPALFCVIAATVVVGTVILAPMHYLTTAKSAIFATFFSSNIYFWRTTGYFDAGNEFKPLLHTWSLAVEEQFYIFLPLAVLLIVRYARRYLTAAFVFACLTSLVLSEITLKYSAGTAYFLLPTRGFELLVGSILAVAPVPRPRNESALNALAFLALALIVVPIFAYTEEIRFPGFNALYPCLGAALLLYAGAGPRGPAVSRLISAPVFRFFGDASYSLYLWHWPVLCAFRIHFGADLSMDLGLIAIAVSVACGYASFRFIEQPFMHQPVAKVPFLTLAAASMLATSVLITPIVLANGFPGRFSDQSLALFNSVNGFSPMREKCHAAHASTIAYGDNCLLGMADAPHITAVWGDSHGTELAYELGRTLQDQSRAVMQITASGCPPALGYVPPTRPRCAQHNATTLAGLSRDPRIDSVVLSANSPSYVTNRRTFLEGFGETVRQLSKSGKKLILVGQLPIFDRDPPVTLGYASARNDDIASIGVPRRDYITAFEAWNDELKRLAKVYDATFIPADKALCADDLCPMYWPQFGALYFNSKHISLTGAERLARLVSQPLR